MTMTPSKLDLTNLCTDQTRLSSTAHSCDRRPPWWPAVVVGLLFAGVTTFTGPALAQDAQSTGKAAESTSAAPGTTKFEPEFRDLGLGVKASDLPTDGYENFACGSNGGPPFQKLDGWTDYMKCRADANGLHEVYVEFGTEIGRISDLFYEQYGEALWLQKYGGTRIANVPVVLSLLFDDNGIAREFRAVTDARARLDDRRVAYLFRFRIFPLYGSDGWTCADRDPAPGENPVGETYLNRVCTKAVDGKWVRVEAHLYRKPGQTGLDDQGHYLAGQEESSTRWEVFDASFIPQPASTLAEPGEPAQPEASTAAPPAGGEPSATQPAPAPPG